MRCTRTLGTAILLLAGCASDLEPLPPEPGGASPAVPGPADPAPAGEATPPPPGIPAGLLDPARSGDRVLEGVVILDPVLLPDGPAASFRVRNGSGGDLPDLILGVVFAVPGGDGEAPILPRIVTVEVPLARGETREVRAVLGGLPEGVRPNGFRVVASPPELLAAAGPGAQGTTFLGGLLECVSLEADLTAIRPSVEVGLLDRSPGAALPSLEGQLILARAGSIVWSGPWILVPRGSGEGAVRTIRWNLPADAGTAGCSLFLRVRAKR